MTLLVLLPAAARAWIVASDLRLFATYRLDDVVAADAGRLRTARTRGRLRRYRRSRRAEHRRGRRFAGRIVHDERRAARRGTPNLRRFLAQDRAQPPEVADDFFVDALLHRLEQREARFLVLDERVALAVAAQADAFLQVVEAVEVVLPLLIDDLQHDVALDALQHLAANELFLLVVRRDDPFPQAIADFIRRQVVEVEAGRIDREDARDLALERLEIPLLEVGGPCRVRVDEGVEDVLGKQRQILAGVENLFAPFIVLELD